MARRTKQDAEATRCALLDAAEHLFHARGVSRTSLADIAAAAGATRGAIYWHFRDKADLVDAMMERVILPLEQSVLAAGDPADSADAIGELRQSFAQVLTLVATDAQAQRVFNIASHQTEYVDELAVLKDRRLAARGGCLARIAAGLRAAAVQCGVSLALPAEAAAYGLHAMVDGLIRNWLIEPDGFDLPGDGARAMDAYLAGLGLPVAMTPPRRAQLAGPNVVTEEATE